MAISKGSRLGRYEIRSSLGSGGMGEVYLAYDRNLQRSVALKVLNADLATNKNRLVRFKREAYAASSLNHPNIITIYEIGSHDDDEFIVTEFIDGVSLGQRLRREGFELSEVVGIGLQVVGALAAAHDAGIMHRDIKPDNIMIRHDGLVKVLDFGLAKLSDTERGDSGALTELSLTMPGVLLGTAKYMSPEQARGLPTDTRTDIWSLGVVLYEMLAEQVPFRGQTMGDVLAAILVAEPESLRALAPGVPEELERIITRALRKEKEERYQQARDLAADLQAVRKRLDFEAELERLNELQTEDSKETKSKRRNVTLQTGGKAGPERTKLTDQTLVFAIHQDLETSSMQRTTTEHFLRRFNLRRLAAFAIVILVCVTTLTMAYFFYARHSGSNSKPDITSLAVLPFTNASNDPEQEYLSDGISESLINRLSELPGVKVIANSSSFRYKGKELDLAEVAQALGVSGIMTGRVLRRGDDFMISVELIDGRDRTQIWGEQYKRKAADLVSVQGEISREIVERLRLRLTEGRQQQITEPSTVNPEAYEQLLKGRYLSAKGGTEERKQAAEYFRKSIAIDGNYAPSYADLSDIYRSLASSSVVDPNEYLPKAEAAARKALELDQNLAEAHYSLANLRTYAWDWKEAEQQYQRALQLAPNLALAHRWYGAYLRIVGRHEEAIAEINRARELDPLSPGVNATVGYIYLSAGKYEEALAALRKAGELDENYPYTQLFLGFSYSARGMWREAIIAYEKTVKLGLDTPGTRIYLGAACARAGDRGRAQTILTQLQNGHEYVSPAELAMLYGSLGELDPAFSELEKAYATHDLQLQYLKVGVGFDPLRSDARFQNLLQRVGLK